MPVLKLTSNQLKRFTYDSLRQVAMLVEPDMSDYFEKAVKSELVDALKGYNLYKYKDLLKNYHGEVAKIKDKNAIPKPPPLPVDESAWNLVHRVQLMELGGDEDGTYTDGGITYTIKDNMKFWWITDRTIFKIKGRVLTNDILKKAEEEIKKKYEDYDVHVNKVIYEKHKTQRMPNINLYDIKLKKVSLRYKMIDDVNKKTEKEYDNNECVLRYIVESLKGQH